MDEKYAFAPARRQGLLFQAALALIFGSASLFSLFLTFRTPIGLEFIFFLMAALVAAAFVPWAIYRWLALRGAVYLVERNGLRIRWGLRLEEIPMSSVRWVRLEADVRRQLGQRLPMPLGALPGAILGTRQLADKTVLDYLASDFKKMVLVATDERVFILSPEKVEDFLYLIQRLLELGTISPWQRRSQNPTFILGEIWRNRAARLLLGSGLISSLALLTWVSLLIPKLDEIYLGYFAEEAAPAAFLLLLPLVNSFFYLVDAFGGLYFYRRSLLPFTSDGVQGLSSAPFGRIFAYLLWGCSLLTTIFFYFAISFMIDVG
ncbi:MAG: PH domain-containing protein [Anaerolineales bacterium]